MTDAGRQQLEASVTLPFSDESRAAAALRGWLRLAAADVEMLPDWSTLKVTELPADADELGRTWWRWAGSVATDIPQDPDGRLA